MRTGLSVGLWRLFCDLRGSPSRPLCISWACLHASPAQWRLFFFSEGQQHGPSLTTHCVFLIKKDRTYLQDDPPDTTWTLQLAKVLLTTLSSCLHFPSLLMMKSWPILFWNMWSSLGKKKFTKQKFNLVFYKLWVNLFWLPVTRNF